MIRRVGPAVHKLSVLFPAELLWNWLENPGARCEENASGHLRSGSVMAPQMKRPESGRITMTLFSFWPFWCFPRNLAFHRIEGFYLGTNPRNTLPETAERSLK